MQSFFVFKNFFGAHRFDRKKALSFWRADWARGVLEDKMKQKRSFVQLEQLMQVKLKAAHRGLQAVRFLGEEKMSPKSFVVPVWGVFHFDPKTIWFFKLGARLVLEALVGGL